MAMPSDDDDDEEGRESASPTTIAAQVLDTLSNHLPPDKLFTPLVRNPSLCVCSKFDLHNLVITLSYFTQFQKFIHHCMDSLLKSASIYML